MESRLEPKQKANAQNFLEHDIKAAHELGNALAKAHIEIASVLLVKAEKNYAIIILDDLTHVLTSDRVNELKLKITETCYKAGSQIGFHTMLATDIWKHYAEKSDQVQEILRTSYVVKDKGFISPLQDMFVTGKIRPTKEAITILLVKAEKNLKSTDRQINAAVVDIYWAVVDAGHAAVMSAGMTPPSPEDLGNSLRELAKQGKINKRCPDIMDEVFRAAKEIIRRRRWSVTGKELDRFFEQAAFFQHEMEEFVKSS